MGFGSIKDIVRADEKQAGTELLCCTRNVDRSLAIYFESQVAIGFAAIDIGVGSGENNPVRMGTLNQAQYLAFVSDISIRGAESCDVIELSRFSPSQV